MRSNLTYFSTISIDSRRFPIVEPGVIEHKPYVVDVLPGVGVLAYNSFHTLTMIYSKSNRKLIE